MDRGNLWKRRRILILFLLTGSLLVVKSSTSTNQLLLLIAGLSLFTVFLGLSLIMKRPAPEDNGEPDMYLR